MNKYQINYRRYQCNTSNVTNIIDDAMVPERETVPMRARIPVQTQKHARLYYRCGSRFRLMKHCTVQLQNDKPVPSKDTRVKQIDSHSHQAVKKYGNSVR